MPDDATDERAGEAAGAARERIRDDLHALFERRAQVRPVDPGHRSAKSLGAAAAAAAGIETLRAAARKRGKQKQDVTDRPALTAAVLIKAVARAVVAAGIFTVSARKEGRSPRATHALAYVGVSVAASVGTTYLHDRIRRSAPRKAA
jgi:hypothetical protein